MKGHNSSTHKTKINCQEDPHRTMLSHRSHSAAPMDSPSSRYRGRSQSPTGHRSLSPPDHRSVPYSHGYIPARYIKLKIDVNIINVWKIIFNIKIIFILTRNYKKLGF